VKEIYLIQNECGTVGANELIEMAPRVPNLEVIQLDENSFLPDVVDRLNDALGDKLGEMDDNIDDEDYDENLDPEDLEDDLGVDGEDDEVEEDPDEDVDALAGAFSQLSQV